MSGQASSKVGSNHDDAQSVISYKSITSRASGGAKMIIHHEDPAAAMNPSEEQWNAIVQQNLKNFEMEKQRVLSEKKEKLKKI